MQKIDKQKADAYFRARTRNIVIYLVIWAIVSYGVVAIAESFNFSIMGFPFHYYMGAQGAVIVFIILLFLNAKLSDNIDKKFGISEEANIKLSQGKTLDH